MASRIISDLHGPVLAGAWIVLACIVNQLWRTVYTGRFAASLRDARARARHRRARRTLFWLFALEVGLAEFLSWRPNGSGAEAAWLLYAHLTLVACLVAVALLIVLRYDGERVPRLHRAWAYRGFVPLSLAVICTGGALLYWNA